jgi:hypothetical protein
MLELHEYQTSLPNTCLINFKYNKNNNKTLFPLNRHMEISALKEKSTKLLLRITMFRF